MKNYLVAYSVTNDFGAPSVSVVTVNARDSANARKMFREALAANGYREGLHYKIISVKGQKIPKIRRFY